MKDTSGSGSRTLTTVYRPLSTSSALSQAGAVRAGESASNCIYFNPRAQLHVPAPLVAEVFPGFVDWSAKLTVNGDWPSEKLTEKGTLDLFHYLRLVLLRGAAALQETHPDFALFSHWPFNSPQFISWSGTARREIARLAASDESCRLQREVSPEVAREIARMHTKASERRERSAAWSLRVPFRSSPINQTQVKCNMAWTDSMQFSLRSRRNRKSLPYRLRLSRRPSKARRG